MNPNAKENVPPPPPLTKTEKVFNYGAFSAHLSVFVVFLILFATQTAEEKELATVDIFRTELGSITGSELERDNMNYPVQLTTIGETYVPIYLLVFFALTALVHLCYATNGFGTKAYTKFIDQEGWNPIRWGEYAATASLMTFILALVDGTREITSIVSIMGAIAATQIQGAVVEKSLKQQERHAFWKEVEDRLRIDDEDKKKRVQLTDEVDVSKAPQVSLTGVVAPTVTGWLLVLVAFFVIFYNFGYLVSDAKKVSDQVPSWLYAVGIVQFIFFSSFGFVQLAQIDTLRNERRDLKQGIVPRVPSFGRFENVYILLSFASKLSLGSFIAYGLWQRVRSSV